MKDVTGDKLGRLADVDCPICHSQMYDTLDNLFWYCPKCEGWFDRGDKHKSKRGEK